MHDLVPITQHSALPPDATDEILLEMWLFGRPVNTQRAYRSSAARLFTYTQKSIKRINLLDLQDFAETLTGKSTSQSRILNALKSLFTFAHELGYIPFNTAKPLKTPEIPNTLSDRIMTEEQVIRMLALETNPRNHAILRLLYASGIRVSELCALKWKDILPRGQEGQITVVLSKGGKGRSILISRETYQELKELRKGARFDAPVFVSRGGGKGKSGDPLDESSIRRIIYQARERAGLEAHVSPHWLRHAHASHALDAGAPVSLVKETLGHASLVTTSRYTHARPNESSGKYLKI